MPVRFPDPLLAARNLARAALTGRTEPEALGVTVSTRHPSGGDESRPLPFVQVSLDGSLRDARLDGRATIRLTVWHRDAGLGLALAGLLEALLLDARSAEIRGCTPGVGPQPTDDPDTGAPLAFFTITARLRPSQIT